MKFRRNLSLGSYSEPRTAVRAAAPMTAAAARAEERQRIADVFASGTSKGKERTAARLLAESSMPAAGILELLADVGPDPVMRAGSGKPSIKAPHPAANASWGRTFARLGWE